MPEMQKKKPAAQAAGGGTGTPPEAPEQGSMLELLQSPKMLAQLRMALPKHVTPERLARIVMTQIRVVPDLLRCTQDSLLGSIMQAAQLGLEPGVNGQCWLIPYKRFNKRTNKTWWQCQLIIGYRGMAQLAWRSSLVKSIASRAVFEDDFFFFDYGTDDLQHRPCGQLDPDKLTHVYALVHTTSGGRLWEVLTRAEVDHVRSRSAARDDGPWKTDYAEMAKKTALRRLFKIAPASAEMARAMELEDSADRGEPQTFDVPMDGYSLQPDPDDDHDQTPQPGPAPTAAEDLEATMQLSVVINERAEEFEKPDRARLQIVSALEKEFGNLDGLAGEPLRAALAKASIVRVDVS